MAKTVLIVCEMQNDFLWEKRKSKFSYDAEKLTAAVKEAAEAVRAEGGDVIFLKQIFADTPSNHIIFDFCIAGSEGAALYGGLDSIPAKHFEKNVADAYSDPAFAEYMQAQGYERVLVCGIDENGTVSATAKGAKNAGAEVCILSSASASRFPIGKLAPLRAELKAMGIQYI